MAIIPKEKIQNLYISKHFIAKRFHNLGGKGHSLAKRCWQLGMYLDGYIIRTVYQKNIFCKKEIYFAAVAINLEHFGIHIIYYYPYRAFGGQNKIVYSTRFVTRRAILILPGQYN